MKKLSALIICTLLVGLAIASAAAPAQTYHREKMKAAFKRPEQIPSPLTNAPTPAREQLGKALFFDPRLSGSSAISCASCHNPAFAWGDALPKGIGHGSKPLGRRTPTILNTAFADTLFWDGRAESLEEQALGPISAPAEMNLPQEQVIEKLQSIAGYAELFAAAYPGEGITLQTIAKALAVFERTVISGTTPFDRWVNGEETAISEPAKRGFDLFTTKANCVQCHAGWNFTDNGFHDIGLSDHDLGRGQLFPDIEAVRHAFKTPTLRSVDRRAPYMHDGSQKRLEDVVALYNRGGSEQRPSLAAEIKPLGLDQREMNDLCDFLRTLTSKDRPVEIPILPN